jgi:hypothetical protein
MFDKGAQCADSAAVSRRKDNSKLLIPQLYCESLPNPMNTALAQQRGIPKTK